MLDFSIGENLKQLSYKRRGEAMLYEIIEVSEYYSLSYCQILLSNLIFKLYVILIILL